MRNKIEVLYRPLYNLWSLRYVLTKDPIIIGIYVQCFLLQCIPNSTTRAHLIFIFDIFALSPSKFSLCGCTLRFVFVVFINCSISFNWWWHLQMYKAELLWDRYEILTSPSLSESEKGATWTAIRPQMITFCAAFVGSWRFLRFFISLANLSILVIYR